MEQVKSTTASRPRLAKRLHRPGGLKRLIKPLAVRVISSVWVNWYKLRYRNHVRFGKNFVTNGRLVIRGPGRVIFGDDINAWSHAEKNVLITSGSQQALSPVALVVLPVRDTTGP